MNERQLAASVASFLRVALPREAVFTHVPNEGRRGWHAQRDLKQQGVLTGFPDLMILYGGKAYFIELKSAKGVVMPHQKEVHQMIRNAGFDCFVARSLDDVVTVLNFWAIPLKATACPLGSIAHE